MNEKTKNALFDIIALLLLGCVIALIILVFKQGDSIAKLQDEFDALQQENLEYHKTQEEAVKTRMSELNIRIDELSATMTDGIREVKGQVDKMVIPEVISTEEPEIQPLDAVLTSDKGVTMTETTETEETTLNAQPPKSDIAENDGVVVEMIEVPIINQGVLPEHLTKSGGVFIGPSGRETYYNLNMSTCIKMMRDLGYSEEEYPYWIRDDGCKMLGDYVMCAANFDIRPKGTFLDTSLGAAIVVDTGSFIYTYPEGVDICVNW